MARLYGRAGRLTARNTAAFRPGQSSSPGRHLSLSEWFTAYLVFSGLLISFRCVHPTSPHSIHHVLTHHAYCHAAAIIITRVYLRIGKRQHHREAKPCRGSEQRELLHGICWREMCEVGITAKLNLAAKANMESCCTGYANKTLGG